MYTIFVSHRDNTPAMLPVPAMESFQIESVQHYISIIEFLLSCLLLLDPDVYYTFVEEPFCFSLFIFYHLISITTPCVR